MLYTVICYDRPGSFETRMAARSRHIAYLKTYLDKIVDAGPMLDNDGRACGTFILLDVPDRATAEGFVENDPYAQINLFESAMIRPFRAVIRDKAFIE